MPLRTSDTRLRSVQAGLRQVVEGVGWKCLAAGRRLFPRRGEEHMEAWLRVEGDATLRVEYDLSESSLVFDLGGYEGRWTSDIFSRYGCTIHVFEPVPEWAAKIERRFERNSKIHVHPLGLGSEERTVTLHLDGDGTSEFRRRGCAVDARIVRTNDFLASMGSPVIDLMKINIEGGEYDLLEHLLDDGYVSRVRNIQVQFHDVVEDADGRMASIQEQLSRSHRLTYQYPFVWENWELICPS